RLIEGDFGDRTMEIDALLDSQRRTARFRLAHQARMTRMRLGIEGKPIKWIAAADEGGVFGFAEIGQQPARCGLSASYTRIPAFGAEPAGDYLDCSMVELAQQRRLPTIPHLRTDGANVRDSQHQEQLQSLRRLHALDKITDRLPITDIELEGGAAHQQVPAHQPGDRLGLLRGKPQTGAEFQSDLLAELRVIAATALGDIVQQHREIKSAAGHDRRHQLGSQWELRFEKPALDLVQDADCEQRVLIDRVDMVHVVLHLSHDTAEIGNEAAEDPGLVHPPQRRFWILARGQDFKEQAVRLRILAEVLVDEPE